MIAPFEPSRTRAFLVGIEAYTKHSEPAWNLNGPAQDACKMAQWLIDRGVQPAKIQLLVKPLKLKALEIPSGVTLEPLTFDQIDRSCINRGLEKLQADPDNEVLILFWSGHGMIDDQHHRHLILSDDRDKARSTVNFDSMARYLRRDLFGFAHQILIVDACADLYDSFQWKEDLSAGSFNQGASSGGSQFALYACSPGQSAINDEHAATGVFFCALLPKLKASDQWPPDVRLIAESLHSHFLAQRESSRSEQVPDWFFHPQGVMVPLRGPNGPRTSLGRIPRPADTLLFEGREDYLKDLKQYWKKGTETIVGLVAPGGLGKSTIVWHFMHWLAGNDRNDPRAAFEGCSQVMEWSFYSQGQHDFQTDSGKFLGEAISHLRTADPELSKLFQDEPLTPKTDQEKAVAAADSFIRIGGVMILDGVEPLQYLPNPPDDGQVRDKGLSVFLKRLAENARRGPADPKRLLLITTRWTVGDLRDCGSGVVIREVQPLEPSDGAKLLLKFRLRSKPDKGLQYNGVSVDASSPNPSALEALEEISRHLGGHPLTLMMVASILIKYHNGQIENIEQISGTFAPDPEADAGHTNAAQDPLYRHARRVIRSYSQALNNDVTPLAKASRELLFQLGLFDRPAELYWLRAIGVPPPIAHLSEVIQTVGLDEAILHLRDLRLVADAVEGDSIIDAHPLVREYFGRQLAKFFPESCREAHRRLFEYFGDATNPQTLEEMHPWFQKIVHGCKAGLHQQALKVFVEFILRGEEDFAARQLGAYGPLLTVVSHFFEPGGQWEPVKPGPAIEGLRLEEQFTILKHAGTYLTPTKGYAAKETEECYRRGVELAKRSGKPRVEFEFAFGQWRVTLTHGMLAKACQEADQLHELANALNDDGFRMVAYRAQTVSRTFFGDFKGAVDSAAKCQWPKGWNLQKARASAWQFLNEPYITSQTCATIAKWHLGFNDSVCVEGQAAIELADRVNHPHTTAVGLYFCSFSHMMREDFRTCRRDLDRLVEVTSDHRFLFWKIGGQALSEILHAQEGAKRQVPWGEVKKHLDRAEQKIRDWRGTGAEIHAQFWYAQVSRVLIDYDQLDEAALILANADRSVSTRKEGWWAPEIRRLRGMILARKANLPNSSAGQTKEYAQAAQSRFLEAVSLAREFGSVVLLKRAKTDLQMISQRFGE